MKAKQTRRNKKNPPMVYDRITLPDITASRHRTSYSTRCFHTVVSVVDDSGV